MRLEVTPQHRRRWGRMIFWVGIVLLATQVLGWLMVAFGQTLPRGQSWEWDGAPIYVWGEATQCQVVDATGEQRYELADQPSRGEIGLSPAKTQRAFQIAGRRIEADGPAELRCGREVRILDGVPGRVALLAKGGFVVIGPALALVVAGRMVARRAADGSRT